MSFNAINGSAINATRFPGAESGLTLVEMEGVVQVTATIPAVTLRLTAKAITNAAAVCAPANFTFKSNVDATTVAAANAIAVEFLNVQVLPATVTARADGVAAIYRRYTSSADTVSSALGSADALNRAPRSASTPASAFGGASAIRLMSLGAQVSARAIGSAGSERHVFREAAVAATATGVSRFAFGVAVYPSTVASATCVVTAVHKTITAAITEATAQGEASFYLKLLVNADPISATAEGTSDSLRLIHLTADPATPVAESNAGVVLHRRVGAATSAQAIAESMAEDYGLLVNAPDERLMIVPASDRRMEVTL